MYGKWYTWPLVPPARGVRRIKTDMRVGTLVLQEGASDAEISMTSTKWRKGVCEEHSGVYQKTNTDGKFLYHIRGGVEHNLRSYVVHTNYDEYAIFLPRSSSRHGPAIMAKLYATTAEDSLLQEFREVALSVGILRTPSFYGKQRGMCPRGSAGGAHFVCGVAQLGDKSHSLSSASSPCVKGSSPEVTTRTS
ncbi:Protein AMBP [Apodemus speciosus]|uniref:Protein AMBP n=1 Tax=Apodemus speciosus TaxID=105296 RepID=A0ABQ0ENC4_APOSI